MRDIVKLGGRLLIFSLVAALLLGATNMITKGPIEEQKVKAAQSAQREALPSADSFEPIELPAGGEYPLLTAVYEGKHAGNVVGYVLTASPQGYGGLIPITMAVGVDGAVQGIAVGTLAETAGIGSRVAEPKFLSQYEALPADPGVIENRVDTISGATVSSLPFKQATKEMASFTMNHLGIEPHEGTRQLAGEDLLRKEQLADANMFELLSAYGMVGDFGTIQNIYRGIAGDATVGYTFELASQGYIAPIVLRTSIDAQGKITGVRIVSQEETNIYGARLATEEGIPFLTQFAGKNAVSEGFADDLDVLSNATVSSNAIIRGVSQAVAFYEQFLVAQPDVDEGIVFEEIVLPKPDDYKAVQSAQRGLRDGTLEKYRFTVRVTGYHEESPILMRVDVDTEGNFLTMLAIEQHETPGIGAEVFTNAGFLAGFITKPAAVDTADGVQAVSGATITSDAIKRGLKQVARAYQSLTEAGIGEQMPPAAAPVFPTVSGAFEGAEFEPLAFSDEGKQFPTVKAIDKATKAGTLIGYRFVTVSTGYNEKDKITLQIEIDVSGTFIDAQVLSHAETKGFGADLLDDPAYVQKIVGKSAVAESSEQIDRVAGATLTSDAFRKAIKQAAVAYQAVKEVP